MWLDSYRSCFIFLFTHACLCVLLLFFYYCCWQYVNEVVAVSIHNGLPQVVLVTACFQSCLVELVRPCGGDFLLWGFFETHQAGEEVSALLPLESGLCSSCMRLMQNSYVILHMWSTYERLLFLELTHYPYVLWFFIDYNYFVAGYIAVFQDVRVYFRFIFQFYEYFNFW